MLYPMLEMAGTHSHCISDILYIYNYNNPLNDEKVALPLVLQCQEYIRQKTPYKKIDHLVLQGPDLIIFSYDRPLQLYALLESIDAHLRGLNSITIMYRASDENFAKAYQDIQKQCPAITFIRQINPPRDFKPLLMSICKQLSSPYILFAVDDIIVKDSVNLIECVEYLERCCGYGFYLRLGLNLNFCYPMQRTQAVPPHTLIDSTICSWYFDQAELDWAYAHTVDMTLYRTKDVEWYVANLNYFSPNTLEGEWAGCAQGIHRLGLCYTESKIVNLPLNQVNSSPNVHMHWRTPEELLALFEQGLKIDIAPIKTIEAKAAHVPYEPIFIKRRIE